MPRLGEALAAGWVQGSLWINLHQSNQHCIVVRRRVAAAARMPVELCAAPDCAALQEFVFAMPLLYFS